MTVERRIAFLICFGPEVRAFVYSGLAQRLAETGEVLVFAPRPDSRAFTDQASMRTLSAPHPLEPRLIRWLRAVALQARVLWLSRTGTEKWRHYLQEGELEGSADSTKPQLVRRLASWLPAVEVLTVLERMAGRLFGGARAWQQVFGGNDIRVLVVSSFGSTRALPAMQAARQLGMAVVVVTNSWKDVFVHPHLHVWPDRLLVWDDSQAEAVRHSNPLFPPDRIRVVGSLHLQGFLTGEPPMSWSEFAVATGLDSRRPYVCYSAASPRAVCSEERIVEVVLRALATSDVVPKPQLLLRLNPMEDGSRFREIEARWCADLVIQRPEWEWDSEKDWCCALPDDFRLWHATVKHALGNVSIPSTVTLEFAAAGKPVVNVCFDADSVAPPEESNRRFWDADFYTMVRRARIAKPVFHPSDIPSALRDLLEPPAKGDGLGFRMVKDPVEEVAAELTALTGGQ